MKIYDNAKGSAKITYGTVLIEGLNIAYREAGDPGNPQLVLLHGFPASSHQYRNLIPALADRFHVLAPDYPGFGNSDQPDPAKFSYTFEKLSEITETFLKAKGFGCFGLFMQDYGGPVGFRIMERHPEWAEWLIIQNTNAYEVGFTSAWDAIRNALWKKRGPETEEPLYGLLQREGIKGVYLHGHKSPSLRERQPKTIIFWGQNDVFFTREGGEAYLRDLPQAEMYRLDSGHFAVEDSLEVIASNIRRFYSEKVSPAIQAATTRSAAQ